MQLFVGLVWPMPAEGDLERGTLTAGHHLGCGYLAAHLKAHGVPCERLLVENQHIDDFARMVVDRGIRILGFSVKDTNYFQVRGAAAAVTALDPTILIVMGGLTATYSDALILSDLPDAVCVRAYGETAFLELTRQVRAGTDWRGTPGISWSRAGKVVRNPDGARSDITDGLDQFPSPYLSGELPLEVGPSVGVSTSRGCVFRCAFCNPTAMAGFRIAFHSEERVLAELRAIDAAVTEGPKMMLMNEDIFALNPARTRRLCGAIASANLTNLRFGCETRIEHLDAETLQSMWDAGFRFLKFGLESANPMVLNTIRKVRHVDGAADGYQAERAFLDRVAAIVPMARGIGFRVAAGVIFGLPGEGLTEAIETLDFVRRIEVDEYYHNFIQLFPGTELFERRREFGYVVHRNPNDYPSIYRTEWPYPVHLVPRLEEKTQRSFKRNVVQL